MVRIKILAVITVLLVGSSMLLKFAIAADPAAHPDAGTVSPVFVKLADVQWQDMHPELGDGGPQVAVVHSHPKTGATQLYIRARDALHAPLHFHSTNETHTVIKGTQTFECGGHRAVQNPGDSNFIPARDPHQAWLSAGAIVFITVDGPWDINWINGPPTKADLGDAAVVEALKP